MCPPCLASPRHRDTYRAGGAGHPLELAAAPAQGTSVDAFSDQGPIVATFEDWKAESEQRRAGPSSGDAGAGGR